MNSYNNFKMKNLPGLRSWSLDDIIYTQPDIKQFRDRLGEPLNVKQQALLDNYVKPFTWEGTVWLDGGWGPKNEVLYLLDCQEDETGTKLRLPMNLMPVHTLVEQKLIGQSGEYVSVEEKEMRYELVIPGEQYRLLLKLIQVLKELGVKEQIYVLNSYFSSQIPEEGSPIYQLRIVAT